MIRNVLNISLQRKKEDISTYYCSIGKTIELPKNQFERFKNNLLYDYDFIEDNQDVMSTDNMNIKQCLLVLGEGQDDGILVYSEGQPYASQSAYLPQARTLWRLMQYPELDDFNARMERIVERYVKKAVERNQDGMFRLLMGDLHSTVDNESFDDAVFMEMISTRPEIEYAELFDDELVLKLIPEYSHCESADYRLLTEEDVSVICALHTLWLHNSGGEQADFSGCEIRDVDLRCKPLGQAILDGAKFVNCRFEGNGLKEISAEETVFSDCSFYDVAIEDSNLKGVRFYNTDFTATQITRTNMTDAVMQGCAVSAFGIKESCIQGADFDNISRSFLDTSECTEDEEWWQSHYRPDAGMTM